MRTSLGYYKEQMYVWRLTITDYKKHSSFSSEDVLLWELMELPKLYGNISLSKIVFSRGTGGGVSGWQWSTGPQRWRWCPEDPGILGASWQVLDGNIGSLGHGRRMTWLQLLILGFKDFLESLPSSLLDSLNHQRADSGSKKNYNPAACGPKTTVTER